MELKELRNRLDEIDKILEEKFAERMNVVCKIGEYKKANGLPTLDASREAQVLAMHTEAHSEALKPYIEEYFKAVMAISREFQDNAAACSEGCVEKQGKGDQKNFKI